ncbi:MAG TPA: response regulator transcription factor [Pyrinomonadaceae bacterium]|jgi:DNA-binding response OmpR family regulator|nr:response regulator transcription factor [Pyrinomonadaceae bacterium]
MKILVAEDDAVSRRVLETTLVRLGHEVLAVDGGEAAWSALGGQDSPELAFLDWMMPGMDGVEVCRRAREAGSAAYIILLTARGTKADIAEGLGAGADDYVVKPFDRQELTARLNAGLRIVGLRRRLAERVSELEAALANVKRLQGLLPICSYCKNVRSGEDYWQRVESYVADHSDLQFSHGICPDCYAAVVEPQLCRLEGRSVPAAE